MPTREQPKQPKRDTPTRSNESIDVETVEPPASSRGDALTSGGNKIHGDELEGIIPGRPSQPHTDKHPK